MKLSSLCSVAAVCLLLPLSSYASEQPEQTAGISVCEQGECTNDLRKLRRLSRYGSGDASAVIALAYASGEGYELNPEEAVRFLQQGVRQNSAMAMFLQSDWYRRGFLLPQDEAKAMELLDKAVAAHYAPAIHQKASLLIQTHQEEDIAEAVAILQQAAEQRHMDSMYLLARLQQFGLGTEQDLPAAGRAFRSLAINGYPNARQQLDDVIQQLQSDDEQQELITYFEEVDNIEVIQVVGQPNQLNTQLGNLARQLDNSGQFIRGTAGSRIRGSSCENSGSPCAVIAPDRSSSSINEMLTGSQ
ncbi:MAG: sel1 repeat family protein [Alkalimonas sp.]|nr:sel1 repeat family protein [Alkalimonas sp.]